MKFNNFNIVTILLCILVILTLIGRLLNFQELFNYSWALIFPVFTYLYYSQKQQINHFFGFFLIGFSIAEFLKLDFIISRVFNYYLSNGFVVAGYISLLIFLIKDFNLKKLIKRLKLQLIVLIAFNAYLIFVLNQMILQDKDIILYTFDFALEVIYNLQILLLLSSSLLHYLYHETKKSLLLFFASVCIVFSEMVQVAYLFISSEQLLQIAYTLLMGIGFYFLYIYIKIRQLQLNKINKPA
ncbi:MAG: hypothetical protein WBF67_02900 [Olleya sp.]